MTQDQVAIALYLLAVLLFVLAALGVTARVDLTAVGLAVVTVALLIGGVDLL